MIRAVMAPGLTDRLILIISLNIIIGEAFQLGRCSKTTEETEWGGTAAHPMNRQRLLLGSIRTAVVKRHLAFVTRVLLNGVSLVSVSIFRR
jgi:hypothetical protein